MVMRLPSEQKEPMSACRIEQSYPMKECRASVLETIEVPE
jgi:hypothetical protein